TAALEHLAVCVDHQKRRVVDLALGNRAAGDEESIAVQAHRSIAVVVGHPTVLVQPSGNRHHLRAQPGKRRERHQTSTSSTMPTINDRIGRLSSLKTWRTPLPSRLTRTRSPRPAEQT